MALQNRPPIVTIMGHVDHGKTSLLDYIRKAHVVDREAGGITQHIGAYQAEFQGKKITFIDTPGHAAFNKMRARGAKVTDLVVLVVAANDGVKPQTVESIRHIKEANVPVIVAINKIDLPNVYPDMAKAQLAEEGIAVTGFGGDVEAIELSAKTGQGVDKLLETILLTAEINNYQADPEAPLQATVIEATLDKKRGPVATVIVQQGTLKVRQDVLTDTTNGRVKMLADEKGQSMQSVLPGCPAEIIGFSQVPAVGAEVNEVGRPPAVVAEEPVASVIPSDSVIPSVSEGSVSAPSQIPLRLPTDRNDKGISRFAPHAPAPAPTAEDFAHLFDDQPKLRIILKADVQGTLEALQQNLEGDSLEVLRAGVGEVTEDDLLFAETTGALILVFHTKVSPKLEERAKAAGVKIKKYDIIYKLLEDLQKQMLKLIEPTIDETVVGEAEIVQIFDMKGEHIAGCRLITGELKKTDKLHLKRGDELVGDPETKSIMHGKEQIEVVKAKGEFGITFKQKKLDFQVGDHLVAYTVEED